jgi:antitoxin component YwqK of YwqJK toxin-antitoxin module
MRYIKIYRYIITIELCEDSIHNENRINIINKLYATYRTNKFKILEIEEIDTKKLIDKYNNYKVGDIITKNKNYYFTKERAFFEFDYQYFDDTFDLLDKLYYIKFFKNGYSGLHRDWYDSGQLYEEFYHINGIFEGMFIQYHEDGKIKCEFKFINNVRTIV